MHQSSYSTRFPCSIPPDLLVVAGLVVAQHSQRLVDLALKRIRTLDKIEQLSVVHLQQHARDLAGLLRLMCVDQRIEQLSDEIAGRGFESRQRYAH